MIGIGAPYANIGDMSAEYSLLMKDKFMRTKVSGSISRFMFNLVRHLPTENVDLLIRSNGLSLQEFIDSEVRAEIQQEIGRLRSALRCRASLSHLRKEESLTYYFVGDYDLSQVVASLPGLLATATMSGLIALNGTRANTHGVEVWRDVFNFRILPALDKDSKKWLLIQKCSIGIRSVKGVA